MQKLKVLMQKKIKDLKSVYTGRISIIPRGGISDGRSEAQFRKASSGGVEELLDKVIL